MTERNYPDEHETFVAERSVDVAELERFAASPNAITREGAALGIRATIDRLTELLEVLAENDPSPAVRSVAEDMLP